MSVEEAILFVAVIALALALVAVVVGPKLRSGRRKRDRPPAASAATAAPADQGAPDAELPLPPPLAARVGSRATPAGNHLICPTCRRQFSAGLRFCPYDARLLSADGQTGAPDLERELNDSHRHPTAKICPTCARRYESVAVVCARDGAPLVSVN
jgi:hypothetical protein